MQCQSFWETEPEKVFIISTVRGEILANEDDNEVCCFPLMGKTFSMIMSINVYLLF